MKSLIIFWDVIERHSFEEIFKFKTRVSSQSLYQKRVSKRWTRAIRYVTEGMYTHTTIQVISSCFRVFEIENFE